DACDWRDVAQKDKVQIVVERWVDGRRRTDHQYCVTVGRCAHDGFGTDIAACACSVLDHELLAEPLGEVLCKQAGHDVLRAAGREADDPAHRPRRIALCASKEREGRQRGGAGGETQELSTGKAHGSLLGIRRTRTLYFIMPCASLASMRGLIA